MKRFDQIWVHLVPGLFVFLWSTGFIGARFGLPYAEQFTFLFVRFLFTLAVLFPVASTTRARWLCIPTKSATDSNRKPATVPT